MLSHLAIQTTEHCFLTKKCLENILMYCHLYVMSRLRFVVSRSRDNASDEHSYLTRPVTDESDTSRIRHGPPTPINFSKVASPASKILSYIPQRKFRITSIDRIKDLLHNRRFRSD